MKCRNKSNKKIFIVFVIFLFIFIMPKRSYATNLDWSEGYTDVNSVQEALNLISTKGYNYAMCSLQRFFEKEYLFGFPLDGSHGEGWNFTRGHFSVNNKSDLYKNLPNNYFFHDDVGTEERGTWMKSSFNCQWWTWCRGSTHINKELPTGGNGSFNAATMRKLKEEGYDVQDASKGVMPKANALISNPNGAQHASFIEAIDEENRIAYISEGHGGDNSWGGITGYSYNSDGDISGWFGGNGVIYYVYLGEGAQVSQTEYTDEDEGNIFLNALINLLVAFLDAIQSFMTKLMTGLTFKQSEVAISDIAIYPNLNLVASEEEFSGWKDNKSEEDDGSQSQSSGVDTTGDGVIETEDGSSGNTSYYIDATNYKKNYKYINIRYSPEEIFSNSIDMLSINFFNANNSDGAWGKLRNVIVIWFRALRYLGLAGLLSVLIYIGIKTMISSSTTQKADFKQGIVSWIVGILIMFILPYIMSFIINIGNELSTLFDPDGSTSIDVYVYDAGNHEGKSTYTKFSTNLMGLVRFQTQSKVPAKRIGFVIMYAMLIIITIRFTIMYFKRMIYMAYLTMISPIVALMYPIDKSNGGGAQGFNEWIKSYTINALIQPVHLLSYYILVGAAMNFATSNIIYTIIALGFISELENILRKIFGFESGGLGTVGGFQDSTLGVAAIASTATNVASMIGNNVSKLRNSKGDDKPKLQNNNDDSDSSEKTDFAALANENQSGDEGSENESNENDNGSDENSHSNTGANDNNSNDSNGENNNGNNNGGDTNDNNGNNKNDTDDDNEDSNDSNDNENGDNGSGSNSQGENSNEQNQNNGNTKNGEDGTPKRKLRGKRETIAKMAEKRFTKATYNLGYRKGQGFLKNAGNIGKNVGKRAIKGVATGAKIGGSVLVGAGAAVGQAAFSLASDGKYNPLAVGAGTNKLLNKAGKKASALKSEFNENRLGKKEIAKRERMKNFRDSQETYNLYQKKYMEKGSREMRNRLDLGEKIAGNGITDPKKQIEVMNYMDSMVDKDFNKQYGKMSQADKEKEAARIQKEDKSLNGMSADDTLKWNMMHKDSKYMDTAVTTAKARDEIPANKVNGTDKDWNAYVNSMAAGDENTAKGYNIARKNIQAMNAAQVKKKK